MSENYYHSLYVTLNSIFRYADPSQKWSYLEFFSDEAKLPLELREKCYENPPGKIAVMIVLEFTFILLYRL